MDPDPRPDPFGRFDGRRSRASLAPPLVTFRCTRLRSPGVYPTDIKVAANVKTRGTVPHRTAARGRSR